VTPEEALNQITNYLNWTEDEFHLEVPTVRRHLRAILAEVKAEAPSAIYNRGYRDALEEEPGGVLDRAKAREAINDAHSADTEWWMEDLLDALALCVRPAAIDRKALIYLLDEMGDVLEDETTLEDKADRILALLNGGTAGGVEPTPGVTLHYPEDVGGQFRLVNPEEGK
jgi:hypothetical protein